MMWETKNVEFPFLLLNNFKYFHRGDHREMGALQIALQFNALISALLGFSAV